MSSATARFEPAQAASLRSMQALVPTGGGLLAPLAGPVKRSTTAVARST